MSFKIKIGKDRGPRLKDPVTGDLVKIRKMYAQDPSLPKNKVTIQLDDTSDPNGYQIFQVNVHSTSGPGVIEMAQIYPGLCRNANELVYKVMVGAGAAAEHLCEMYGDVLDPDKCAVEAQKQLREFCLMLSKTEKFKKAREQFPV